MTSNEANDLGPEPTNKKDDHSPIFKSVKEPVYAQQFKEEETVTKSETSFVMDVTKRECVTTTMRVRRNRKGKLRYSIHKQAKSELDGVLADSPTLQDRIRQDSVARDYIPELSKPSSKLMESQSGNRKQHRRDKRRRKREKQKEKKRLEKLHEVTDQRTEQVLTTNTATPSAAVAPTPTKFETGQGQSPASSIPSASEPSPNVTPVVISSSIISLPKAMRSEVRLAPRPIQYETLPVAKLNSGEKSSESGRVVAESSPAESFHSALAVTASFDERDETPSDQTSVAFSIPTHDMQDFFAEEKLAKSKQPLQSEPITKKGSTTPLPDAKSNESTLSNLKYCTPYVTDFPSPPSSPTSIVYRLPPELKPLRSKIRTPSPPAIMAKDSHSIKSSATNGAQDISHSSTLPPSQVSSEMNSAKISPTLRLPPPSMPIADKQPDDYKMDSDNNYSTTPNNCASPNSTSQSPRSMQSKQSKQSTYGETMSHALAVPELAHKLASNESKWATPKEIPNEPASEAKDSVTPSTADDRSKTSNAVPEKASLHVLTVSKEKSATPSGSKKRRSLFPGGHEAIAKNELDLTNWTPDSDLDNWENVRSQEDFPKSQVSEKSKVETVPVKSKVENDEYNKENVKSFKDKESIISSPASKRSSLAKLEPKASQTKKKDGASDLIESTNDQVVVVSSDIKQANPQPRDRPFENTVPSKEGLAVRKHSEDLQRVKSGRDLAQLSKEELNFLMREIYPPAVLPLSPEMNGAEPKVVSEEQTQQKEDQKQMGTQLEQPANVLSPISQQAKPDDVVMTVQSSVTKLSQPETVSAPFESAQRQLSEEKVPHNKSSVELQKGILFSTTNVPNISCGQLVESTGDPDLDRFLANFKLDANGKDQFRPLTSTKSPENCLDPVINSSTTADTRPGNESPFDAHVRFYRNQERFLCTMRAMQPSVPSDDTPSSIYEQKPIETKKQLIECQQSLMEREDVFMERIKDMATGLRTVSTASSSAPGAPGALPNLAPQPEGANYGNVMIVLAAAAVALFAAYMV